MKKTCIVTGGSSGIGLSIVKTFIANDYQVFNLDITPSDTGEFIRCDVSDVSAVKKAITAISDVYTIDVLVSNAVMHFSANIENTSEEAFDKVFALNVKGAYAAVKSVLPSMKTAKKSDERDIYRDITIKVVSGVKMNVKNNGNI